jgi:hypothetical protein
LSDTPASPRASRLAAPRWLDGRLVLGVLLVLVSVVVGARVLSSADRSTLVWAATGDLAAGSQLDSDDLTAVRVRLFDNAGEYLRADAGAPPTGYLLSRPVGGGELVPLDALSRPEQDVDYRLVTVPVAVGHLPPSLRADQQVDVWVTPEDGAAAGGAASPAPERPGGSRLTGARLVLAGVTVDDRRDEGGALSASTVVPVVLQVRPEDVGELVSAMSLGRIDLVRVPRAAEATGALTPSTGEG